MLAFFNTAQDYLFRGIQKSEWANLFEFIQAKRLRVENLDEAAGGPGGGRALDLGDDIDTGTTHNYLRLWMSSSLRWDLQGDAYCPAATHVY